MLVFSQLMLISMVIVLFGAGFIYLGFRRAQKETARLNDATTWDYMNQGAGYWTIGAIFIGYGVIRMLALTGSLIL